MRYRTALRTGRTAAMQAQQLARKYSAVIAPWLMAGLLLAGISFSTGAPTQTIVAPQDAAITLRVESALARHAGLKTMDIKVGTRNGVVSLNGFVRSVADIAKAGTLTGEVRGVAAVKNRLRVADRPSRA